MEPRAELYREALARTGRGERVALATVVSTSGSTPQKAVDEMLRVVRNHGILAIGATHNPDADNLEYKTPEAKILGSRFRRVEEFRALLGRHRRGGADGAGALRPGRCRGRWGRGRGGRSSPRRGVQRGECLLGA